jgi:hypothetical protein
LRAWSTPARFETAIPIGKTVELVEAGFAGFNAKSAA